MSYGRIKSIDPEHEDFIKFLEEISEAPLLPFQKQFARMALNNKKFRLVHGRKGPMYIEVDA